MVQKLHCEACILHFMILKVPTAELILGKSLMITSPSVSMICVVSFKYQGAWESW